MSKIYTLIIVILFTIQIFAQTTSSIILNKSYDSLPFQVEVDNSGIYGISHFEIENDEIILFDFSEPIEYKFRKNKHIETNHSRLAENKSANNQIYKLGRPIYADESEALFPDEFGLLKSSSGISFELEVENLNTLLINYNSANSNVNYSLSFPGDLAFGDLIGIDETGTIFLIVERYLQQVPLRIKRQVYTLSGNGRILSILDLPDVKYLYMISDLQIDADGNLYHLLTAADGIEIIKWSGLKNSTEQVIKYPSKYDYHLHFNELLPTREIETIPPLQKITDASRTMALRIGEAYAYHQYNCSANNLAPTAVQAPDGDWVRTPSRLIVGPNARVSYKWGGFQTLAQYDQGLANGKYAGDIHTDGVSSYAVGVDCSGFVSRCWQMSYHASTSYMPNITNLYSHWSDLKPGDAVHKVGHVRLYVSTNANGRIKTVESTSAHGWGVVYWDFAPSDLTDYSPRYYTGMVNDYFENIVELKSVTFGDNNIVNIVWDCDDTEVVGYRIYRSNDGENWEQIFDESTVQSKSVQDTLSSGTHYYRVSSVKNDNLILIESDLSNMLGIGKSNSNTIYLIVDGFDRTSGSWRGPGHKFAARYGESIFNNNVNFESIKANYVVDSGIDLNKYFGIFWIAGDESTADESFSDSEQQFVKNYLKAGGNLFVSGSEIGWDLYDQGSTTDKDFFNNYLKAAYISDDAGSLAVNGLAGSSMEGCSFHYGQLYEEDYPDEIGNYGGSSICMKYANNKGAGIEYSGTFGSSNEQSKLIYFGFPLETTADDIEFDHVLVNVIDFFNFGVTRVEEDNLVELRYYLSQNYPNPFNPVTTIRFSIPRYGGQASVETHGHASLQLRVYDMLGNEIATLLNEDNAPGEYEVEFDAGKLKVASGIYFYQLQVRNSNQIVFSETKKLMLIK